MVKPTTIYMDTKILQAIKMKAVQGRTSVSRLVDGAVRMLLKEDALDLESAHGRRREPVRSFGSVLKDLKRDGLL